MNPEGHGSNSGERTLVLRSDRGYGSAHDGEFGKDRPVGLHRNSEQAVFQIREWQMSQDKQIFNFEQCGEVLIVTATGSFMEFRDNDIRNGYNEAFRQLSEPGIRHLLVDFSAMQYFGSTFVGILIRLAKKARANKGDAALCNMSDSMKDMLKTLMLLENPKIDFSWVAYPDRSAALQALSLH